MSGHGRGIWRIRALIGCLFVFSLVLATHQSVFSQTDEDGPLFEIEFDKSELFLPCPAGCVKDTAAGSCSDTGGLEIAVNVISKRRGSRTTKIWFEYEPETGSVKQTAGGLKWDLDGAGAGTHWLKIKMNEGFETIEALSKSVEIGSCDCTCKSTCAKFSLEAEKSEVVENQVIMLRAVQSGYFSDSVHLGWQIENGEVLSGQGTNIVRVRAGASGNGDLLVNFEITQPSVECEQLLQLRVPLIPDNENDQ